MNNWEQHELGFIADIKLSNVDKLTNENERVVRLCNYTDVYKNSFINFEKSENFMIASCNEDEYEKFILRKGQVAITKDSETPNDIGVSTYISEDFEDVVLGYHLALITPNTDKLNGRFLHYWLNTKQVKRYFENNAGGSGQRCTLVLDCIKSTPLYLPNLPIQQKIAKVLSDIDDKINLNNKINAELEAMAKLIYDYWFIKFDFPNANGKPYKLSCGKMIWNKELKREIPEGWKVENLKKNSLTSLIKPGIDDFDNEKIYLATADVSNNNINFGASRITFKNRESRANMQPIANSIWFAKMKNSKKILYFGEYSKYFLKNLVLSTGFAGLECKENHYLGYIWKVINNDHFEKIKDKLSNGATQEAINNDSMSLIPLIIPSENILKEYHKQTFSIYKKIYINQIENQKLTELRDWLLPMLMNGQLKIS